MPKDDDIQTDLNSFKKIGKNYINIYNNLRQAKLFKIQIDEPARPDPIVTLFDCLFVGQYERILTQYPLNSSICAINNWFLS